MIPWVLTALGSFGISGMTVLFPLLARGIYRNRHAGAIRSPGSGSSSFLEVLIPAHNEESTVSETLISVQSALKESGLEARIQVGADSCSDRTVEVARSLNVTVREFPNHRSKWKTMLALIQSSRADWVALADSGAVWPRDLVKETVPLFHDPAVVGVAPSYQPRGAGKLESWHWALERFLKNLENGAGGPMSVHGATVFYRRTALLAAVERLQGRNWLNDDVVIPLMVRALHPEGRIVYLPYPTAAGGVSDMGLRVSGHEKARRARLAAGNSEWIRILLPRVFRMSPVAGTLALRRVFRVYWAYWFLFVSAALLAILVVVAFALLMLHPRIRHAAFASFAAPVDLVFPGRVSRIRWI